MLVLVDLEPLGTDPSDAAVEEILGLTADRERIYVGRCNVDQLDVVGPVAAALSCTLVASADSLPPQYVGVANLAEAEAALAEAIACAPQAAVVLDGLLRRSEATSIPDGLLNESLAYSDLLGGQEFATWLACRPRRDPADPVDSPVLCRRDGDVLSITLNRPERHNALGRHLRDALCDALDVAIVDSSVAEVRLTGAGPSFCSGGDLEEFGTQTDLGLAHEIRIDRSVGRRLAELADRTVVDVHGACIGAGIELPAFASTIHARADSWFQLPELGMGLIPGAGGTVSLPRRIGRWRTAWLALSGARLDVDTAVAWGLVDARSDD